MWNSKAFSKAPGTTGHLAAFEKGQDARLHIPENKGAHMQFNAELQLDKGLGWLNFTNIEYDFRKSQNWLSLKDTTVKHFSVLKRSFYEITISLICTQLMVGFVLYTIINNQERASE